MVVLSPRSILDDERDSELRLTLSVDKAESTLDDELESERLDV